MKRRLTCAVLALCLLLSGCAATGTTSPQRYSVTWWDVFDTVTVISGYADSEADWNTRCGITSCMIFTTTMTA